MKFKEKANTALTKIKEHLRHSKIDSLNAVSIKAEGFTAKFNKLMMRHRTKFNILGGFSAFVVAGFYGHIIVGFVVLGLALFAIEYLSGGDSK